MYSIQQILKIPFIIKMVELYIQISVLYSTLSILFYLFSEMRNNSKNTSWVRAGQEGDRQRAQGKC